MCPKRFPEARKNNAERNKWVQESSVGLFSSPTHLGCRWENPYLAAPGGSVTLGIAMFPSDRAQESFLKVTQVKKREEKKAQVETGKNEPANWRDLSEGES